MARFIALLLILVLGTGPGALVTGPLSFAATAQSVPDAPDYQIWEKVATRAEVATGDGRASNTALEEVRAELVGWRSRFSAAQGANKSRISTLQNQITSLGPAPGGGGTEPAVLTARRTELTAQLTELEAPKRRAEEAFSRANGLIREIDQLIRDRQAARLFELKPSPLKPSNWPAALRALASTWTGAKSEVQTAWSSQARQKRLNDNLVETLVFLLIAAVLLLRGRRWMVALTLRAQESAVGAQARLRGFVVSLGQVILPVTGIAALAQALFFTDLLGLRGQVIVDGLAAVGGLFFLVRWLSLRLLPRQPLGSGAVLLPQNYAPGLRNYGAALAVAVGLDGLLLNLEALESYSQTTRVTLHFPIIVISGFLLYRFGRLLLKNSDAVEPTDDAAWNLRSRAIQILARVLVVVGVVVPLVAAIGFYTAASAVIFPVIRTIALLALVSLLSAVARDIYAVITRCDDDTARAALVPVLVDFAIVLATFPALALIWGARISDLTEVWAKFLAGFRFGDTRISPADFLTFAIVFVVGYMLTRIFQSTLRTSVLPKTKLDVGGQTAIVSGLGYVGIFLAAVVAITTAGIDLSSLAIVAGALSVGIGFGLQNIVSNFVSGIILLIERPIAEGDWIEVAGYSGTVREISVRSTRIETFDRTDVIIPNSDLISGAVINYTRGNVIGRAVISVGVAYGSDTTMVQDLLLDIAKAHPMVSLNPGPAVHLVNFGADSLDFQIRAVLRDVNFILTVKSDILHEIVRQFAEKGIEIPFAQRDVWLRNPETLPKPAPQFQKKLT